MTEYRWTEQEERDMDHAEDRYIRWLTGDYPSWLEREAPWPIWSQSSREQAADVWDEED